MKTCEPVLQKCLDGKRLTLEEGISLYSLDLLTLGKASEEFSKRFFPKKYVTFVVDRNISYTNVCNVDCGFCAFHKGSGDGEAYTLSKESILEKVRELASLGGTQVMIQGGVNKELPLDYYLDMVRSIHEEFPSVHIHSFSAIELCRLSEKENIPLLKLLKILKDAGLNSVPGGGAEILVERVRKIISPKKISSEKWLNIMRTIHESALKSTATMVFGHVETIEERIIHLIKLRELQDETNGFRAFIPWSFSPQNTPTMSHLSSATGEDYLKTIAIARLMLDNFQHIQSGWLTEGLKLAQVALRFGCDDIGGTLIEDKVLEPTGIKIKTRKSDLINLIKEAGFVPAERNTNYEILRTYAK